MRSGTNNTSDSRLVLRAVQAGIPSGLIVCVAYPLLSFGSLPNALTVSLAALMGPALGIASYGLYRILDADTPRVSGRLGVMMNALAGALLCAMLLVQLAVRLSPTPGDEAASLVLVWLGLDVAWDVYVGLGTICFAIAMLRHPRFGPLFAYSGLVVATALLVFNLFTFPNPPAEVGLVDLGPAVGLWYLVVTIRIAASLSWLRRTVS